MRLQRALLTLIAAGALALALTACSGSPHQYDAAEHVAAQLKLDDEPGKLAKVHFGAAPRVEGSPPTVGYVFGDSAREAELQQRIEASGFEAWVPGTWKKDTKAGTVWVRLETLTPGTKYTPPNGKPVAIPDSGAVLISIFSK